MELAIYIAGAIIAVVVLRYVIVGLWLDLMIPVLLTAEAREPWWRSGSLAFFGIPFLAAVAAVIFAMYYLGI